MKRIAGRVTLVAALCLALTLPLFADAVPDSFDAASAGLPDAGVSSGLEEEIRDVQKRIAASREQPKEETEYFYYEYEKKRNAELARVTAEADAEIDRLIRELSRAGAENE